MDVITFYEKPGCLTNKKQKALLESAGYRLQVKSLLERNWQADELGKFFADLPVSQWFNPSAPAIKLGMLDPATISQEEALDYMTRFPLLIRRPLLIRGNLYMGGFDLPRLNSRLGIDLASLIAVENNQLESCSHSQEKKNNHDANSH